MKIEWDKVGSRFYELGASKGVLYIQNKDGTYKTGVPWNGLVSVTESPEGAEPTDIYADNIKYATLRSAETFGGTIEAYTYPDEFSECDGSSEVVGGLYIGQQSRSPFGFSYVTQVGNDTGSEEDDGYKIHLIYNLTASPSEKAYSTINDSPEAITFSWEVKSTPVNVTDNKPTSAVIIDSLKVKDKTKLKKIEDVLYGSTTTEPRLPLPDEVIGILKGSASTYSEPANASNNWR